MTSIIALVATIVGIALSMANLVNTLLTIAPKVTRPVKKPVAARVRAIKESLQKFVDITDQFHLEYQAIVDIETGAIVSIEALTRWESPALGKVRPIEFIPLAEAMSVTEDLTHWVIKTAIKDLAGWGCRTSISVNVSPVDLESPVLLSAICHECALANVDKSLIELEVTERAISFDQTLFISALKDCHSLKIKMKVDDFGTGDSSFKRFVDSPLWAGLKIDMSLIPESVSDRERMATIRAISSLCHDLEIECIAEGIETPRQIEALKLAGITRAQGFYFYRPMVASALTPHIMALPDPKSGKDFTK